VTEIDPRLRSELERLVPLPRASRLNWDDVVDRGRSRWRRRLVRSRRTVVVAIALVLLIGGGVALAASALFGGDPLAGPPAPPDNDAALRALFPPYRIGHATQLAEYEGRKLFGARTASGGYCFSATSPTDPKGEGGHCVSKAEALRLDASGTVAFTMSGWSAGGYAPGAREVRISGAGIDVTVPVAENGWWVGVARLPLGGDRLRSPLPVGHDRGFVVATSVGPDGRVLGRARLMIVTVTRDDSGRVLTVGFGS
jgi:hypothetical protein